MKNLVAKLFIALAVISGIPALGLANTNSTTETSGNLLGAYEVYRLQGFSTHTYRVWLNSGHADIIINGDGDTDLDLFVYDGYGNLITRRNNYSDYEKACFNVAGSGYFTVVVRNLENVYNDYQFSVRN